MPDLFSGKPVGDDRYRSHNQQHQGEKPDSPADRRKKKTKEGRVILQKIPIEKNLCSLSNDTCENTPPSSCSSPGLQRVGIVNTVYIDIHSAKFGIWL